MPEDSKEPLDSETVTLLLKRIRAGSKEAEEDLLRTVYGSLRRLAAHYMRDERPDHTLQPTALVHEAYLRIFGGGEVDLRDRSHFFAVAARQMRQALVDHARAVRAEKRGAGAVKVCLDEARNFGHAPNDDIEAVDEALSRLEELDPQAARVVELKFFGGLTDTEVAETLGVSFATIRRDWEFARVWLFSQFCK
jgi:RNA polymerase sigma-70 factor (ECF subfamily)